MPKSLENIKKHSLDDTSTQEKLPITAIAVTTIIVIFLFFSCTDASAKMVATDKSLTERSNLCLV